MGGSKHTFEYVLVSHEDVASALEVQAVALLLLGNSPLL